MDYSLLHVRATADNVDDALRTIAAGWNGQVIAPQAHLAEVWSTVVVTGRTASSVAPLLSEFLDARVVTANVAGDGFGLSYYRPGSPELRADGSDDSAVKDLAAAFGKDTDALRGILRSPAPPAQRHAEAAELLMLPLPVQASHQQPFEAQQTIQPSQLRSETSRFRSRRRLRRIFGALGVLEFVAFLAVDYFWFLEPSILVVPALAVFVVNGIVLILLWRKVKNPPSRS
ncbi:hypothetical protein [Flindersiella endophytica]